MTKSCAAQKSKEKASFSREYPSSPLSSATFFVYAFPFSDGFILTAAARAHSDLGFDTSASVKRNWRLRLDSSMLSMSVTVSIPFSPQHSPISAIAFSASHPRAPAPTKKQCTSNNRLCIV
ncbi:hypothetical protein BLNAU_2711 [Blattamonas nauphoetae]|uniref:Uncharacterized protein n=1 Tax=Blattamonas nauphoetae TaxID=2049346 RepID=A0ABQ9YFI9_9EUKA|nr:hypothetical protein BLNAU_2711 [Blattamonas nauphoetae]